MFSDDLAISISNISKCYQIYDKPSDRLKQFLMPRLQRFLGRKVKTYYREFWALTDISFDVKKGETIGIIGRNGSGKSTLLQMICGTLTPTNGAIQTTGRIAALLELGAGFNVEYTGRENVYMNAALLGMSVQDVDARFDDIANFADIGDFIDQPVKTYSSGMFVRLAFSVAVHSDPEILIIDEALSVGDAFFQAKCAAVMKSLIDRGVTILFVSHDTHSIKALCDRAALIDQGKFLAIGETNAIVEKYYTQLVSSGQKILEESVSAQSELLTDMSDIVGDRSGFNEKAKFQRIENGMASFINVRLIDVSGQDIQSVEYGQNVTLRMAIKINKNIDVIGFAYHIRDKNGLDIVYSDTGIEKKSHLYNARINNFYIVDWSFIVSLREGDYSVACMASVPKDLNASLIDVCDFIPVAIQFKVFRGANYPLYGAVHWENQLEIKPMTNMGIVTNA